MTDYQTRSDIQVVPALLALQVVNVLDNVMVMPLGPLFARGLGVPESTTGFLASAYTGAAAVGGLAGAFFLDRFERRSALSGAVIGLALGTVDCTALGTTPICFRFGAIEAKSPPPR